MTHNERVLQLLSDGRPHSHHELYALHVIAHSRVSDLRKQGHTIEQWREGDDYLYRLLDGDGGARRELTSAVSVEQSDPPVSRSGCSPFSAPERHDEPADPPGVGAFGVAHASDGAGAENTSGDTSAGRVLPPHAAGNGSPGSASPEQLSIIDVLKEQAA